MDPFAVLGIFLMGAAAGALLTWIAYAAQIRKLHQLIDRPATRSSSASELPDTEKRPAEPPDSEKRKSA
jgi:hypothetical protein